MKSALPVRLGGTVYTAVNMDMDIYVYLSVYLSVCLSIYLSISLSIYLSIWFGGKKLRYRCSLAVDYLHRGFVSLFLLIWRRMYMYICLSVYLSIYLSIYIYIYEERAASAPRLYNIYTCEYGHGYICISVYPSVCLSVYLSIYLSVYLSIYLYLSICISSSLYLYIYTYTYIYMTSHFFSNPAKVAATAPTTEESGQTAGFLGFPTPHEVAEWPRVTASSA